jgi:hypothetical protein
MSKEKEKEKKEKKREKKREKEAETYPFFVLYINGQYAPLHFHKVCCCVDIHSLWYLLKLKLRKYKLQILTKIHTAVVFLQTNSQREYANPQIYMSGK